MNAILSSPTDETLDEQRERESKGEEVCLLWFVEHPVDELQTQSHFNELALQMSQLVEQHSHVMIASFLCSTGQSYEQGMIADQASIVLKAALRRGFRRLLLVPWGSRPRNDSLVEAAVNALSTVTQETVFRKEVALPLVHVDGVSSRRSFEGLSSIQSQLAPLLEAFPAWDRTWTSFSSGQVEMLLLRSEVKMGQLVRIAPQERPTLRALTAALCPTRTASLPMNERSCWQRDGQIYANYLASLLRAAIIALLQEQT